MHAFNLILIFIQFNPRSFNSIPIVILFNPYSFNSIFRSSQCNFVFFWFDFNIVSIQFLYSFNSIAVYSFNAICNSLDPIFIFIQFNPSLFVQSSHSGIYSIWGSGSRGKIWVCCCILWIHKTRDYFPATLPMHAKISRASTITINVIVVYFSTLRKFTGKQSRTLWIHDI